MNDPLSPVVLREIDKGLRRRYSDRLARFGTDPRTLGWDRRESQRARFAVAVQSVATAGRSIMDIGCGLADFRDFLDQAPETRPAAYHGVDINPDLIEVCRERFPGDRFSVANILVDRAPGTADLVFLFGVLNFRFAEIDNRDFSRGMIAKAFALAEEALVVDMLTARNDPAYPCEDFVYYYEPGEMLDFALSLTPHVVLRHDYASIPQREMMLVLRKRPCGS